MIFAVIRNKSTRWFSNGSNKVAGFNESKIPREDEVTSTIFGTMKYLNPQGIFELFNEMAGDNDIRTCNSMKIELWPRSFELSHRQHVEPDAIFTFRLQHSEIKSFILEVKWLRYEYGENQLEDQWSAFGVRDPKNTRLVYISSSSDKFNLFKKSKNKNWSALTWYEFSTILSKQTCSDANTSSFFRDIHLMLSQFNTKPFEGFSNFHLRKNKVRELSMEILKYEFKYTSKANVEWGI